MEHVFKHEQLPSGKTINRHFGDDGSLIEETHSYGLLDIAITLHFKAGTKIDETYFAKKGMVSRRTYEKVRIDYADMPEADGALQDSGAKLLKMVSKERKQRSEAAKRRQPNPGEAQKLDAFCLRVMKKGRTEDAFPWIENKNHTLGERNWNKSKRVVERLLRTGSIHIYACKIDVYGDGIENTGHLVIELPTENATRGKILKEIDPCHSETA